jgi:hypothetical protein
MNLDWIETPSTIREMAGKRVIRVSDGTLSYYATIPADADVDSVIDEFCATYDYTEDGTEEALRSIIRTDLWEDFPLTADDQPVPFFAT